MPGPPTGQRTAEDNLPTLSSPVTEVGHDHLPFVSTLSPTAILKTISLPPSWEDAGEGSLGSPALSSAGFTDGVPGPPGGVLVPAPPTLQAHLPALSSKQLLSPHEPQTFPSLIRASKWSLPHCGSLLFSGGSEGGRGKQLS